MTLVVENPPANVGHTTDAGSVPESGRSPGGGKGNLLQYSCLKNLMHRGDWWATVHRLTKRQKRLKRLSTHIIGKRPLTEVSILVIQHVPRILGI